MPLHFGYKYPTSSTPYSLLHFTLPPSSYTLIVPLCWPKRGRRPQLQHVRSVELRRKSPTFLFCPVSSLLANRIILCHLAQGPQISTQFHLSYSALPCSLHLQRRWLRPHVNHLYAPVGLIRGFVSAFHHRARRHVTMSPCHRRCHRSLPSHHHAPPTTLTSPVSSLQSPNPFNASFILLPALVRAIAVVLLRRWLDSDDHRSPCPLL